MTPEEHVTEIGLVISRIIFALDDDNFIKVRKDIAILENKLIDLAYEKGAENDAELGRHNIQDKQS